MQIHTTRSSLLSSYGYDEAKEMLQITFIKGGTYNYKDVPWSVYDEMAASDSIGKYFLANIKDKYEFEKE